MANPSDFFAQMMPYAQQVSQRTGLDPRLVLAQAALETGYGQSAPGNNFFGIKSHGHGGGNVLQTQEFEGGRMVSVPQSFRGYESPAQSFMDYADFVTSNPRYRPVLEAGDLEGQIRAMGASGYATDPNYATKLAQIAGMVDPSVQVNIPGRGGNMQPQGLLGNATVSTQGQEPEKLPFFQRPEVGNLLDTLAIGFSGMTLNPNQALIQSAQERIKGRRESAQTAQQRNATAAWLESQGLGQLADGVRSGAITGAQAMAMAKGQEPTKGVAVGDRLINPVTGEIIYEPSAAGQPQLDKDQLAALNTIRDDVRAELAPFEIVKSGYNNIITFYDNPGSTSDYALAVAFAKILDPGSVAREGEVQAVQNAGARVPALGQALKNAITGEGSLAPNVRQEIAELATRIYQERAQSAQTTLSQYSELANRAGIPPEFVYAGQIPDVRGVVPAVVPPAASAQGVTQEMWNAATPEEKAAWSK